MQAAQCLRQARLIYICVPIDRIQLYIFISVTKRGQLSFSEVMRDFNSKTKVQTSFVRPMGSLSFASGTEWRSPRERQAFSKRGHRNAQASGDRPCPLFIQFGQWRSAHDERRLANAERERYGHIALLCALNLFAGSRRCVSSNIASSLLVRVLRKRVCLMQTTRRCLADLRARMQIDALIEKRTQNIYQMELRNYNNTYYLNI